MSCPRIAWSGRASSQSVRARPRHALTPAQETIGPLVAGRKSRIPIWLATTLKKQRRCRIVAPDWMAVGALLIPCAH